MNDRITYTRDNKKEIMKIISKKVLAIKKNIYLNP